MSLLSKTAGSRNNKVLKCKLMKEETKLKRDLDSILVNRRSMVKFFEDEKRKFERKLSKINSARQRVRDSREENTRVRARTSRPRLTGDEPSVPSPTTVVVSAPSPVPVRRESSVNIGKSMLISTGLRDDESPETSDAEPNTNLLPTPHKLVNGIKSEARQDIRRSTSVEPLCDEENDDGEEEEALPDDPALYKTKRSRSLDHGQPGQGPPLYTGQNLPLALVNEEESSTQSKGTGSVTPRHTGSSLDGSKLAWQHENSDDELKLPSIHYRSSPMSKCKAKVDTRLCLSPRRTPRPNKLEFDYLSDGRKSTAERLSPSPTRCREVVNSEGEITLRCPSPNEMDFIKLALSGGKLPVPSPRRRGSLNGDDTSGSFGFPSPRIEALQKSMLTRSASDVTPSKSTRKMGDCASPRGNASQNGVKKTGPPPKDVLSVIADCLLKDSTPAVMRERQTLSASLTLPSKPAGNRNKPDGIPAPFARPLIQPRSRSDLDYEDFHTGLLSPIRERSYTFSGTSSTTDETQSASDV